MRRPKKYDKMFDYNFTYQISKAVQPNQEYSYFVFFPLPVFSGNFPHFSAEDQAYVYGNHYNQGWNFETPLLKSCFDQNKQKDDLDNGDTFDKY